MQFLVDPADVARELPAGTRTIPAERLATLHSALRGVVSSQPEFASWVPSQLCLFYFGRIEAAGTRVGSESTRKAPMLALWTVAAESQGGERRDVALELFANSSRLERPARLAGLRLREVRTTVGPMPEDEWGRPSPDDRYTVRIGKTMLQWDGHAAGDSTAPAAPMVSVWQAHSARSGWVQGTLTVSPRLTMGMIGSLKVLGNDALAKMLMRSPTRFVGPGFIGGGGTLAVSP